MTPRFVFDPALGSLSLAVGQSPGVRCTPGLMACQRPCEPQKGELAGCARMYGTLTPLPPVQTMP